MRTAQLVAKLSVGSYPTFSPLPHPSRMRRLFSVTLVRPHDRLPVRKYAALRCPDFPLRAYSERQTVLLWGAKVVIFCHSILYLWKFGMCFDFELEESLFFVESAAVSHQSSVAAYHPVAGDYYRYRIGSVCRSDGTHCLRIAYP